MSELSDSHDVVDVGIEQAFFKTVGYVFSNDNPISSILCILCTVYYYVYVYVLRIMYYVLCIMYMYVYYYTIYTIMYMCALVLMMRYPTADCVSTVQCICQSDIYSLVCVQLYI